MMNSGSKSKSLPETISTRLSILRGILADCKPFWAMAGSYIAAESRRGTIRRRSRNPQLFPETSDPASGGHAGHALECDAAALYLRIPYSNPYDIGWFDAIYAGEMDDLAALADENELDFLKAHLPLLCVGAVLFFFGILLFIIFGLRFKERDYPFLSWAFFHSPPASGI